MQQCARQMFVQRELLGWFNKNKRDLPWRRTRDPYRILVSEIMLQQTQVDRVLPKYAAFLKRFLTLRHLARAKRSSVIKMWSGLGYNNRAVRLHMAAQEVVRRGTKFPQSFDELVRLPGVGAYTARAIQSFAFGERVAAVDVNHARVVRRVFFGLRDVPMKRIEQFAGSLSPERDHQKWNQALMDFGALVCRARPLCMECPLRAQCKAFPAILKIPRKSKNLIEPFLDSNRYFRGRIVDALRKLPHGKSISDRALLHQIQNQRSILPERFHPLVDDLEHDGIIVKEMRGRTTTIMLS